jgi:hypothetical protein
MNDFLEEDTTPLGETPSPPTTIAAAQKKRAIDRWENEGDEMPPPIKPASTQTR